LASDRRQNAFREREQIGGGERDLEPAPAGAHVNALVQNRAFVDHDRQRLLLRERTDAPHHVPRGAFGRLQVGHLRAAPAQGIGDGLEIEHAAHRHHRAGKPHPVDLHHERLEDGLGVELQGVGGFEAVGGGARIVGVAEHVVRDTGVLREQDGRGHLIMLHDRGSFPP
jgi:hypothetical protein